MSILTMLGRVGSAPIPADSVARVTTLEAKTLLLEEKVKCLETILTQLQAVFSAMVLG